MNPTEQSPLSWILYGTEHCHLCELAEQLVTEILGTHFSKVDIADSVELTHDYGVRIPVLVDHLRGRELNWPFDSDTLGAFISGDSLGENLLKL